MGVPVVIMGKGLVNAVVEVLVVGEDDMAADIVQLRGAALASMREKPREEAAETYETLRSHVSASKTTGLGVGVDNEPRRAILGDKSVLATWETSPRDELAVSTHDLVQTLGGTETSRSHANDKDIDVAI